MSANIKIVTTTPIIDGHPIRQYLGIVRGLVVRSPNIAQGVLGGLKAVLGGHNESYTQVCEAGRQDAYNRMLEHAAAMGANAVIGVSYDSSEFMQGATEVICYGTAVILD
jgi:uncharacterized protein YbjQ (UPF0145 family)